ncbi:MAG TPA: hypothetical protein DCZ92_05630 [Elusimicrobia bacterium]|nr:MAG: hypothetical protein A2016_06835 [Elusimicrobia bacterium GWF2_62_30]HBA60286.1 hypothetical protein [Elusimicrobiota bacterium]
MKYLKTATLALVLFTGNLLAQSAGTGKFVLPTPGLKITETTGTVNLMKYGLVVMTLRPGDVIPALVDTSISFTVVDGIIVLEAGREKISAAGGATFTVTAEKGREVVISVAEGAAITIKGSAENVMLATDSEIKITYNRKKTIILIKKGSAVTTLSFGAEQKIVNAGGTFVIPAPAK